jgi:hypothetical protein
MLDSGRIIEGQSIWCLMSCNNLYSTLWLGFGRGRGFRGENRRKRWRRAKHLQAINKHRKVIVRHAAPHPGFYAPGGR